MIGNFRGNKITVNRVLQIFQKTTTSYSLDSIISDSPIANWMSTKTIVNKKKIYIGVFSIGFFLLDIDSNI